MMVWKGCKGDQEQGSALSDEGERHRLSPGKQGPSSCYCHHLQTLGHIHTHTDTRTHTKKIQTVNVEKIWMC